MVSLTGIPTTHAPVSFTVVIALLIMAMPDAYIKTMKVAEWKKEGLVIGKRPCVFLLLA